MSSFTRSPRKYVVATVIAAVTAALAADASLALSLPVWAMFVGWIAFFTRGLTTRSAFENLGCAGIGLVVGALAALTIPRLVTIVEPNLALPIVVFAVALGVVALRGLPVMNNLLGYFLGLITWFAAHLEPSLESIVQLFGAISIGSFAGWFSHNAPLFLERPDVRG
jgi:hypothetical protein